MKTKENKNMIHCHKHATYDPRCEECKRKKRLHEEDEVSRTSVFDTASAFTPALIDTTSTTSSPDPTPYPAPDPPSTPDFGGGQSGGGGAGGDF